MTFLQSGETVGGYRIIEKVGYGGMATVYQAYQAGMDRSVAIKMMIHQFALEPEFRQRFQREVKLIAQLEHPHILPVYDSGEYNGMPYLVMRFIQGGTLKERITAGHIPLVEIDQLFTQLADALGYAHKKGVLHRDIKASNVLLTDQDNIFLTDFGIARLLQDTTELTGTGALIGTPAYMSPEQAEGKSLDGRSDIYSLGIILYEMVTGRVPFKAETPYAVILQHLNEPLPLPRTLQPHIHPEIERVILKALAKDVADRYQTTELFLQDWKNSFAAALAKDRTEQLQQPLPEDRTELMPSSQQLESATPITTSPPSTPKRKTTSSSFSSLPKNFLLAGTATFLTLLLIVFLWFNKQQTTETEPAPLTPFILNQIDSWTAANSYYQLLPHANKLYGAGPGGVSIFDLENGVLDQRLTTADQLPGPWVTSLLISQAEELWVGTGDGLIRFVNDKPIIYNDEDGLDSNSISALIEWDGNIIVATQYGPEGGGLNLFDGQSWLTFPQLDTRYEGDFLSPNITALLPGNNGALWVGTENGLGLFKENQWTRYTVEDGLPDNWIEALSFDRDDSLLISTAAGVAQFKENQFSSFSGVEGEDIYATIVDQNGRYWFAGEGGIWRFDRVQADWEKYSNNNGDFAAERFYSAAIAPDGTLYFGSEKEGMIQLINDKFSSIKIDNMPIQSASWKILPAPDGMLWFLEEYGSGIDLINPQTAVWAPNAQPKLPCCLIPLAFAPDGTLWGGGDTGLWLISPDGKEKQLTLSDQLPSNEIYDVAFDSNGDGWVATEEGILLIKNETVTQIYTKSEIGLGDYLHQIKVTNGDTIWVAGENGLAKLEDAQWSQFTIGAPFSDNFYRVTDIEEDHSGTVWVTTIGDGVYTYIDAVWTKVDWPEMPSEEINNITIQENGRLWFATDHGLFYVEKDTLVTVTLADGLIHPYIHDIYIDSSGSVWIATSGGINRLIPSR